MSETARTAAQSQLDAYNAHDINAFVACYAQDVEVRNLKTNELLSEGREAMRKGYGEMFEAYPDVHAHVTSRTVLNDMVFDHEYVTGRGEPIIVMAVYQVGEDGLIQKVWFAR